MGIRDWFGKMFGGAPVPATEPGDGTDAGRKRDEGSATTVIVIGGTPAPVDPITALRRLPIATAVTRAIESLEASPGAAESAALLLWLRTVAPAPGIAPETRVTLGDFFAARGEPELAAMVLEPLVVRGDTAATPALMRLADLAQQRGDGAEVTRIYEEILAVDIAYPGVRERLARSKAPARVGGAGATLLSPESARLAQGRLELVRELGRGGAGSVLLARDTQMQREVALKIYHPSRRADRLARLGAEARIAASLASRHVVRVYDLFEKIGGLSMEYCGGGALRSAIARGEASIERRRGWARSVAHALAVTHDRGWVHRDLKPGNVLLRIDDVPVLTDFGLASRIGAAIEPYEGTPGYVAPEVRARLRADPRIDVYAFGALARELLGLNDAMFAAVIAACLAPDPDARPRDGATLLRALEDAAGQE